MGTVLVIDDDPAARKLVARMFSKDGFELLDGVRDVSRTRSPDIDGLLHDVPQRVTAYAQRSRPTTST